MSFLEAQLVYARRANDRRAMTTPDQNGQLPLHRALHDKATFGAIKLLVNGNPAALQVADNLGRFPLHIACESSAVEVVKYLVELDSTRLNDCDVNGNSPLHCACLVGNCGVIKYLLERHVRSISEGNAANKLPIHLLLCDCGEDTVDRESPEYLETIWRLLLAHPETLFN